MDSLMDSPVTALCLSWLPFCHGALRHAEMPPVQAGKGSATLSMAYAAAKFAESCVLALQGQPVVECAYVESHLTDLPFFASQVRLGPSGVEVRYLMAYPVYVWYNCRQGV